MTPDNQAELIARLEKATGPSRELDAAIFIKVTPGVKEAGRIDVDKDRGVVGWWPKDAPYQSARDVPAYTASLDAAMTLVPEGWSWCVFSEVRMGPELVRIGLAKVETFARCFGSGKGFTCPAATPALALCIAALKARSAS
jgi:hypothetical protein